MEEAATVCGFCRTGTAAVDSGGSGVKGRTVAARGASCLGGQRQGVAVDGDGRRCTQMEGGGRFCLAREGARAVGRFAEGRGLGRDRRWHLAESLTTSLLGQEDRNIHSMMKMKCIVISLQQMSVNSWFYPMQLTVHTHIQY